MKKLGKIIIFATAIVLCLFTPGMPVAVNGLLKLAPADNTTYQFTAPTQSSNAFTSEAVGSYDLADWNQPSNNYLVTQQVTTETNASFHETYPYTTLSNANILSHSPYVIATNTLNMPTRGCYTTGAITLPANGYYMIEVEYCLKEQEDPTPASETYTPIKNTTNTFAFGTFYLNDYAIALQQDSGWHFKTFYIHTDVLESTSVTPELYFGSRNQDALGAIYFDKFTVTAVNEGKFNAAVYVDANPNNKFKIDPTYYLDFSKEYRVNKKDSEYTLVQSFTNNQFAGETNTYASSSNAVLPATIPGSLNFAEEQPYFYSKDGGKASVMLMQANDSNARLTLMKDNTLTDDYTFKPQPHEVYMFQFYSIATAAVNFSGFYFTITDNETKDQTAEQITNLDNYPYHNGWQLNTIFFVAGHALNQAYTLGFSLTSSDKTTGWACLDEFKIYKVNGSYAADNATAVGVHDTYDMNDTDEELDLPNSYFELGTAADTATITGSSYPYPLVAKDWTTNNTNNGIVNLALWDESFGDGADRPYSFGDYDSNNNIYMMHNTASTRNILTSPAISTTAGANTYISFDAFSKTETKTQAWIITGKSDGNGNLNDVIYLGNPIQIQTNGAWQHYEFNLAENEYAVSRSYYLRFEMDETGYAYIDNVRTSDTVAQVTKPDETEDLDLTNPLTVENIWQATDNTLKFYLNATKDGLTLRNIDGQKTVVQNAFAYNLSADSYYEIIITTRGNNAYLGLSGYDGLLEVTTDEADPTLTYEYKLYVQVEDSTTTNLQITLGYVTDNDTAKIADGDIFIDSIKINSIDETEFDDAKTIADDTNSRVQILSLTEETDEDNTTEETGDSDNSFFGENWWYLVPTLITALALLLAVTVFLVRKIKFDKHITKKNTSYARDMRLKNQHNKIVAQKAAKVDNVTDDEAQSN